MQRLWLLIGGAPTTREARFFSAAALIISMLLTVTAIVADSRGIHFGSFRLGGDFAQFYAVGLTMKNFPHEQIYNPAFQNELIRGFRPDTEGVLIFANAPFLALAFRLLANLPYAWAYVAWAAVSITLYLAGLIIIWPSDPAFARFSKTAFLLAISFPAFLWECVVNGQLSCIGFFAFSACIGLDRRRRDFAAGVALALCAYKPTFLLLSLPMALVSRRRRLLAGFAAGICGLGLLSLCAVGLSGCLAWLDILRTYARMTAGHGPLLRSFKYVDAGAFLRLLVGGHTAFRFTLQGAICAAGVVWLGRAWWRWREHGGPTDLLWAATLAWTLVLGPYVPIYDVTLIVLSAILVGGALRQEQHLERFGVQMALVYLGGWFTQPIAQAAHLQILTPVLAEVGVFALRLQTEIGTGLVLVPASSERGPAMWERNDG